MAHGSIRIQEGQPASPVFQRLTCERRSKWRRTAWRGCDAAATDFSGAEAEAFVKWHAGQLTWAQATNEGRIQLDGPPSLVRAFPTWNARSMFAHIRPVSHAATGPAG